MRAYEPALARDAKGAHIHFDARAIAPYLAYTASDASILIYAMESASAVHHCVHCAAVTSVNHSLLTSVRIRSSFSTQMGRALTHASADGGSSASAP